VERWGVSYTHEAPQRVCATLWDASLNGPPFERPLRCGTTPKVPRPDGVAPGLLLGAGEHTPAPTKVATVKCMGRVRDV
jgi:hypothetical protein